jgi:hypothetical protein
MKRILVVLTLLVLSSSAYPAQEVLPSHPRILLLKGEERALAKSISSDAGIRTVHDTIIAQSDALIDKPAVERKLTGRRLLGVSREALRRIFFLSYSFRMTGDRRYLERAEKEMLAVASFSDWHPDHFLDVAELTTGMAIGYDWLYPSLSEETRKKIRTAIIDFGIKPSLDRKYNSWLKATHNWNQVCNTGMALGALAVYEDEPALADRILERSAESIRLPMAEYDPDGAYPEGYGYWNYGTTYNVLYLSSIEKVFGKKKTVLIPNGFLKTGEYLLNMTGSSGKPFNYSDSGISGIPNPAMYWFTFRTGNASLLFTETKYLSNPKKFRNDRFLPAMAVWMNASSPLKNTVPSKTVWIGGGRTPVALMRSSWKEDAVFIGLKCGTPSTNHAHMDIGSFVMDAGGVRWASDFGMQEYNSLESEGVDLWNMKQNSPRWRVFRYMNTSHNTITLNGGMQYVKGTASITKSSSTNAAFIFAETDLTSLYPDDCASLKRGVAIIDGKAALVRDEISTTGRSTSFRWSMVTEADVTIGNGGTDAVLRKNGKTLLLRAEGSRSLKLRTWETRSSNSYDAPNPGTTIVGFESELPANGDHFFNVYLIPGDAKTSPATPGSLADWK